MSIIPENIKDECIREALLFITEFISDIPNITEGLTNHNEPKKQYVTFCFVTALKIFICDQWSDAAQKIIEEQTREYKYGVH